MRQSSFGESIKNLYKNFLQRFWAKLFAILFLILYLAGGICGCFFLEQGLKPQNLVPPDFHAYKYFTFMEDFFYPMGMQVEIIVNNPNNLTLKNQRDRILGIVHEFESTPHTMGPAATDFFLPEYLKYLQSGGVDNV